MPKVVSVDWDGDVAVVEIDNPPVNATGLAVRQGLMQAVEDCRGARGVALVCAGRTFVAGADVREFGRPAEPPHLPEVIAAIEAGDVPWVAAIHGTALGGGLELALGCHARVAVAGARMGLPEITLGLIPGAGGTVRLSRLVGAAEALRMITSGRPVDAARALRLGLVDRVVEDDPRGAAIAMAREATLRRTLALPPPEAGDDFARLRDAYLAKAPPIPAATEAVAAVSRGLAETPEAALAAEREAFLRLRETPEARALRHVFFAEREAARHPRLKDAAPGPTDRVGVLGGGTMGAGIAAACIMSGCDVTLVERDEDAAEAARDRVGKILQGAEKRGKIAGAEQALESLTTAAGTDALAGAQIAIEAVFEDFDVKRDLLAGLDGVVPHDCVLASNTSYLDIGALAQATARPERVIGLHFFSPAHVMRLVEIVVPPAASDRALATGAALVRRLGKLAVFAGVADGFIANRIMSAYRHEAFRLLEDGATPWQVDRAMRDFGWPMGVFEMQDLAGLDIGEAARRRRASSHPDEARAASLASRLVEMGRLGRKTGAGFYDHSSGEARPDPVVEQALEDDRKRKGIAARAIPDDEVLARIHRALEAEADAALADGTAQRASDIDVVMINAFGYPRWKGGPMFHRDRDRDRDRDAE